MAISTTITIVGEHEHLPGLVSDLASVAAVHRVPPSLVRITVKAIGTGADIPRSRDSLTLPGQGCGRVGAKHAPWT